MFFSRHLAGHHAPEHLHGEGGHLPGLTARPDRSPRAGRNVRVHERRRPAALALGRVMPSRPMARPCSITCGHRDRGVRGCPPRSNSIVRVRPGAPLTAVMKCDAVRNRACAVDGQELVARAQTRAARRRCPRAPTAPAVSARQNGRSRPKPGKNSAGLGERRGSSAVT